MTARPSSSQEQNDAQKPQHRKGDRGREGGLEPFGEPGRGEAPIAGGHGDGGHDRGAERAADLKCGVVEARGEPRLPLVDAGKRRD